MIDLGDQLRTYFDTIDPPFELEEIVERAAGAPSYTLLDSGVALRPRRRWMTAVAAGVATLVMVGGVALLIQQADLSEDPVSTPVTSVVDPAPTTTLDAAPTTTAPPATTAASPVTWIRIAEPAVFGGEGWQEMTDVAVGGDVAVAVGYDSSGGDDDAAAWYSTDGESWTRVPHEEGIFGGAGHQRMRAVAATDSGFVAVGLEGDISQIPRPISWISNSSQMEGMKIHAAVWQSNDGVSWRRVPHDEAHFGIDDFVWMNDVTFGQGRFVAVGQASQRTESFAFYRYGPIDDIVDPAHPIDIDADAAVWVSTDGVDWSRVDAGAEVFGSDTIPQYMNAVTTGGPGFVAVGMEGFSFLGVDDWTPIVGINPDSDEHVMDNAAAVWTSPDGTTWTRTAQQHALAHSGENVPGWATMFDVTTTGSGLVAVGRDLWQVRPVGVEKYREGAAVWLSNDGMSWRRVAHQFAASGPNMGAVIATDDGDLVAAGGMLIYITAGAWTSQDGGNTWIPHPNEDTLFDASSTSSIQGLAVFGEAVIGVGTFDTDAAVWVGTWTETGDQDQTK